MPWSWYVTRLKARTRVAEGDKFVTGYCAVKALASASFQGEVSGWEPRLLLPQVCNLVGSCAGRGVQPFTSAYQLQVRISLK